MKLALEPRGVGGRYHMAELIADLSRLPLWLRAADGAPDWGAVFAGFTATVAAAAGAPGGASVGPRATWLDGASNAR